MAFLCAECRERFYLKLADGFERPSAAMPKIFTTIDQLMKQRFGGKRMDDILPTLPVGVFEHVDE